MTTRRPRLALGDVYVHFDPDDHVRDDALLTQLLGEAPLPTLPVTTPVIYVDYRVHTAATLWLATRAGKSRGTQHESAKNLAYWIHWLRSVRGYADIDQAHADVFRATEDDVLAYHADCQARRKSGWYCEASTWKTRLSALKMFHEYARHKFNLPLPFHLTTALTASGHAVTTTGLSPRVKRSSAGTVVEPAWVEHLLAGALRITADGDDHSTLISERDHAFLSLLVGTGVRRQTAHATVTFEIPPARRGSAVNKFLVPDAVTKNDAGGMALAFESRLRTVRDYIDGSRRDLVDESDPDSIEEPWVVTAANGTHWTGVDSDGAVHNRMAWANTDEHVRRHMLTPDGEPVALFLNERGEPMSYGNVSHIMRRALAFTRKHINADFPNFRPHDCRHTFAVHLICAVVLQRLRNEFSDQAVSSAYSTPLIKDAVHLVSASLGHADPSTTRLYLTSATAHLMSDIPADDYLGSF